MRIAALMLTLLLYGCTKEDNSVLNPVSLPAGSAMLSAQSQPFGAGSVQPGAFSGVKIYDSTDRLVAELAAADGTGGLTVTDVHGISRGYLAGDNFEVSVRGTSRVGLYAGPVNSGLLIDGSRVVGPRLSAIDDATSPEDAVAKLNALLAAMREHGLIEGK